MNKKISTTVALVLLCSPVFCQSFSTPNGTPVNAFQNPEMSDSDRAMRDSTSKANFPNATFLAPSTGKYNCHGYAWLGNQSGQYYWLGDPKDFWEDYSYIPTSVSEAVKISYTGGDHSAIRSTYNPNKYISKWAAGPLMEHDPWEIPDEFYNSSTVLTYYKPNPSPITGPDEVSTSGDFTLNNPPSSITWTIDDPNSPNVFYSGSSAMGIYSIKVTRTGTGMQKATLQARKYSDNSVINQKLITPGPPLPSINGPVTVCYNGSQFTLSNAPSGTIYWTVDNTSLFSVTSSGNPTTVTRIGTGTGSATLSARTGSVSGPVVSTMTITACSPAVISGDQYICFSSYYTINYTASSWSLTQSSNVFSITSSNASSATVTATPKNDGGGHFAYLTAMVNGTTVTKTVIIGAIVGSPFLCPTASYTLNTGQSAVWSVTSGFSITPDSNTGGVYVTASAPDLTGTVTAVSGGKTFYVNISSCGYDVYGKSSGGGSYVTAYPNPASGILTVEIDEVMAAEIRAQSAFKTSTATPNFDVRLYNMSGILVHNAKTKGGNITFDVSTLPNGNYFLHVYDGIIPSPEVLKIIVKH